MDVLGEGLSGEQIGAWPRPSSVCPLWDPHASSEEQNHQTMRIQTFPSCVQKLSSLQVFPYKGCSTVVPFREKWGWGVDGVDFF